MQAERLLVASAQAHVQLAMQEGLQVSGTPPLTHLKHQCWHLGLSTMSCVLHIMLLSITQRLLHYVPLIQANCQQKCIHVV